MLTKKELEKLFEVKFSWYEVRVFNELIKAGREIDKVITRFRRRGINKKVMSCYKIYSALGGKNERAINE